MSQARRMRLSQQRNSFVHNHPGTTSMAIEVKVPQLPESVTEATVGEWQVEKGEAVQRDDNLVDLETDKVVLEVPAVADGVLSEIKAAPGDTVTAGDVLAMLEEGATADAGASEQPEQEEQASVEAPAAETSQEDTSAAAAASPAARKLMDENDIAAADVAGTGKDGRVTKADVQKVIEQKEQQASAAPATSTTSTTRAATEPAPDTEGHNAMASLPQDLVQQRVPMTRIRARIAERLLEASQNTAMLTAFNEVDMQQVMDTRARYKKQFEDAHDVRLGFMSFFVKASVEAL